MRRDEIRVREVDEEEHLVQACLSGLVSCFPGLINSRSTRFFNIKGIVMEMKLGGLCIERSVGESFAIADKFIVTILAINGTKTRVQIGDLYRVSFTVRLSEEFEIGDDIKLSIYETNGHCAKIRIVAPRSVNIVRTELIGRNQVRA